MQKAPRGHSAIHLTFIKLPLNSNFVFKTFVLSIFEWFSAATKKKTKNWFSRSIIKGAFCNTFNLHYATISLIVLSIFEWPFKAGFTVSHVLAHILLFIEKLFLLSLLTDPINSILVIKLRR